MTAADNGKNAAKSATILVVEDDPFLLATTADLLRGEGYEVIECPNASDATTALSSETNISLVFTDVSLPGAMGGLNLVIWIHNRLPSLPVVLTSGLKPIVPMLQNQEAVPFLTKPYASETLLSTIARLLQEADAKKFRNM
jgi:DNA-binding NtrC family response regulator